MPALAGSLLAGGQVAAPPRIEAALTDAPAVPPPLGRRPPATVVVRLDVREVVDEIAPGVRYALWTFGGRSPGKFIRLREGDRVEFFLMNHKTSHTDRNYGHEVVKLAETA